LNAGDDTQLQSLGASDHLITAPTPVTSHTHPYTNVIVSEFAVEPQEELSFPPSKAVIWVTPDPEEPVPGGTQLLDLPIDILEMLCRRYLDICSNTCLGLTCKAFFNITEHLYPFQVSLYTRTLPTWRCLGNLLTQWMAPKYSFDHSWGRFKLKRHYIKDESEIERRWKEKESWPRIRLAMDGMGAVVAYRAKRKGFEEMEHRLPYANR
jgi:hypothetical protein